MRDWALADPAGFRLIYGDPVSGHKPPDDGPGKSAELRACTGLIGLIGLIAAVWPTAGPLQPDDHPYVWDDFDAGLVGQTREDHPDLPPAGLALTLRVWGCMHGLMVLEIYGHLSTLIHKPPASSMSACSQGADMELVMRPSSLWRVAMMSLAYAFWAGTSGGEGVRGHGAQGVVDRGSADVAGVGELVDQLVAQGARLVEFGGGRCRHRGPFGGSGHAGSAAVGAVGFGMLALGAYWAACASNMAAYRPCAAMSSS